MPKSMNKRRRIKNTRKRRRMKWKGGMKTPEEEAAEKLAQ